MALLPPRTCLLTVAGEYKHASFALQSTEYALQYTLQVQASAMAVGSMFPLSPDLHTPNCRCQTRDYMCTSVAQVDVLCLLLRMGVTPILSEMAAARRPYFTLPGR